MPIIWDGEEAEEEAPPPRPPWMPPIDFEERLQEIRERFAEPWASPEFYLPFLEAYRPEPERFGPPMITMPRPFEIPQPMAPPLTTRPFMMPPVGLPIEPGAGPEGEDWWTRLARSRFGPAIGRFIERFGFPALRFFEREAVEPARRAMRPLTAFPGEEEMPTLPEAAGEAALAVSWPLRLGLRTLYELPQFLQKAAMQEEFRRRYIDPELAERGYRFLPPEEVPSGVSGIFYPSREVYKPERPIDLTEEQLEELNTAYEVGEFYPTLLKRPHMRQEAFNMIQAGATAEEIKNTPGMYDFWCEFVGDVLTDPAWFIPAAMMEKVIPFGAMLSAVGRGLKKVPIVGAVFRVTRVHKLRQFTYQAQDALAQFLLHTQADETLVGRFARLLAGDESVLAPMGPRMRAAMEAIRDMFLGRDRELRGLGEKYPPAYLAGLRPAERAAAMGEIAEASEEGLFRFLGRFVGAEATEKMAVGEFTDNDLLYWIRQAVSRAKRNELGLAPRQGALGSVARFFGTGARLFREGLIAPNIAFHQINTLDSLMWMMLDLQFPNILDAPLINRIARRFGRPEMVDDLTRRFGELGLPFPSKLRQPYVGTIIGGEPLERPQLLWQKIPIPGVGKPVALVDALEWVTGKPLGQMARQWAGAEGVAWPKRVAGKVIQGLQDDSGRLARFINRLNISSGMQLISDEMQTELWVRSQTVAQEIFPGTDQTRIEVANFLKSRLLAGGASEEMAHNVWMTVTNPNKVANVMDLDNLMLGLKEHWAPRLGAYEMRFPRSAATDNEMLMDLGQRLDDFAVKPGTAEELDGIFVVAETEARKKEAEVLARLAPEQLEIGELRRLGVKESTLRGLSDDVAMAKLVGDKKLLEVERKWGVVFERLGEAEGFSLDDVRILASDVRERARLEAIDPWLDEAAKLRELGRETGDWDTVIPQIREGWIGARTKQAEVVDRLYMDYLVENASLPELNRILSGDPRYLGVPEAVELAALQDEIVRIGEQPWDSGLKADLDAIERELIGLRESKAREMVQLEYRLSELRGRRISPALKKEIRDIEKEVARLRRAIDVGPTGEVVARSAGEYAELAQRGYEMQIELEGLKEASERLPPSKTVFRVWDYQEGQMRKVRLPDGRRVDPWWDPTISKQIQEMGYADANEWTAAVEEAVRVRGRIAYLKDELGLMPEVKLPTTPAELKAFVQQSADDLERMMAEEVSEGEFHYALSIYEDAVEAYKKLVPEAVVLVNEAGELTLEGKKTLDMWRQTYSELRSREPYLSARARKTMRDLGQDISKLERGAYGLPRVEEIVEGKRSIISLLQEEALDDIGRRDAVTVANAQETLAQTLSEIEAMKMAAIEQYEPIRLWAQEGIWMTPEEMAQAANELGMHKAGPWLQNAWKKHVGDPSGIPTSMDDLRRLFDEDPARIKRWQDYLFKKMGQADLPLFEEWTGRAVSYPGGAAPIADFDDIHREAVRMMADGYESALDRGLAEVGRRFFDYTEEYGYDAFLKQFTPFHLFLSRNIVRYPREMARRPALLNAIRRIPEGSMKFVNEYNLSSRFKGTLPLPYQPLQDQDYYIEQGVLPPIGHGYMYVVDTSNFFSIFGEVPLIYGPDDLPWGWEEETLVGKIARSPELFGLSFYPWWRIPMDKLLGTHKDLPSQDLTYVTRMIKAATGKDIEDPLGWYKTQYDETVIAQYYANLRLLDYLYYYLEENILVDGVTVDLDRFREAINNPEDPLFQRALEEVKEYHAQLNLVRCFEPFGVKGISPAELKARALMDSYRIVVEGQELGPAPLLLGYWAMFDEPHEAELQLMRNRRYRDLDAFNMTFASVASAIPLGTKAWEDMEEAYWEGREEIDGKYEYEWQESRDRHLRAGVPEEDLPEQFKYVRELHPRLEGPMNRTIAGWYGVVDYWRGQIFNEDGDVVNPELFPRYIAAREAYLNQLDMDIPGEMFWGRREFEGWLHRYDRPEEAALAAWEELYARPAGTVIYTKISEEASDEERERLQAEKNEKESWADTGRGDIPGLIRRVLYWHPDWTPTEIARVYAGIERLPEWDQWSRRNQDLRGGLTSIIWNCYMSGYVQTGSPFFEWIADVEDQNTADAFRLFFVDRDRRNINDVSTRTLLLVADRLGGMVELATEGFEREIMEAAREYGEEELAEEVARYMRERPDKVAPKPEMAPPIFESLEIEDIPRSEVPLGVVVSPWTGEIREQIAAFNDEMEESDKPPIEIPGYDLERVMAAIFVIESDNDSEAVNPYSGAAGLGQVIPEYTPYTTEQLTSDPSLNIRESIRDLYDKLVDAGGDFKIALMNYSGGIKAWKTAARFDEMYWEPFLEEYGNHYAPPTPVEPEEIEGIAIEKIERAERLAGLEQMEVEAQAIEGVPPSLTKVSLRGEVYPYLTEEEAESYATARENLELYWELREKGEEESARLLWEQMELDEWFGDPDSPSSKFWNFWWVAIPPGWRSTELKADPVIAFVLDKGLRSLRPGGEKLVGDPQYIEAAKRMKEWYIANQDLWGDPTEYEQARAEQKEYQAAFFTPEYEAYLDLSTEERRAYRKENPWLYDHWETMRVWREEHPIYTKYYVREETGPPRASRSGGGGGRRAAPAPSPRIRSWDDFDVKLREVAGNRYEVVLDALRSYWTARAPFSDEVLAILMSLYRLFAYGGVTFEEWLEIIHQFYRAQRGRRGYRRTRRPVTWRIGRY